jgi:hypothetical protein
MLKLLAGDLELSETIMEINDLREFVAPAFAKAQAGC